MHFLFNTNNDLLEIVIDGEKLITLKGSLDEKDRLKFEYDNAPEILLWCAVEEIPIGLEMQTYLKHNYFYEPWMVQVQKQQEDFISIKFWLTIAANTWVYKISPHFFLRTFREFIKKEDLPIVVKDETSTSESTVEFSLQQSCGSENIDLFGPSSLRRLIQNMEESYYNLFDRHIKEVTLSEESAPEDSNHFLSKSIEFSEEHQKAGLGILSYFNTYLQNNYPTANAKVSIEQDGLLVRMHIDCGNGKKESIEKHLANFGEMIQGDAKPEEYIRDPYQLAEFRAELKIAKMRIETQSELLAIKNNEVQNLKELQQSLLEIVGNALSKQPIIQLQSNASSTSSSDNTININVSTNLSMTIGDLSSLSKQIDDDDPACKLIEKLKEEIQQISENPNENDVAKSSAMSNFLRFLNNAHKKGSDIQKAIEKTELGVDILKDLAGKYNSIAQWCGLPLVPKAFTHQG